MDKKSYKVLVPHDYSSVANCAVEHASKIAKSFSGEVYFLHVVGKEQEVHANVEKMNKIAEEAEKKHKIKAHVLVRIGNIFEDIGDVASEIEAGYIVMGTHGAKGMQKIMGSHAIKVITHSKVPFVIVQEKPPKKTDTYDDIVVPIDYSDVTKQKLAVAASIATHFNSKIHIFAGMEKDEFLQKKLVQELAFAKKYFTEREIAYDIVQSKEKGNFKKQLVQHAAKIDADLIAIVNTESGALMPDFMGSEVQNILANDAGIPVIITNPTQVLIFGGTIGS